MKTIYDHVAGSAIFVVTRVNAFVNFVCDHGRGVKDIMGREFIIISRKKEKVKGVSRHTNNSCFLITAKGSNRNVCFYRYVVASYMRQTGLRAQHVKHFLLFRSTGIASRVLPGIHALQSRCCRLRFLCTSTRLNVLQAICRLQMSKSHQSRNRQSKSYSISHV